MPTLTGIPVVLASRPGRFPPGRYHEVCGSCALKWQLACLRRPETPWMSIRDQDRNRIVIDRLFP
jgi:hypothetical protein